MVVQPWHLTDILNILMYIQKEKLCEIELRFERQGVVQMENSPGSHNISEKKTGDAMKRKGGETETDLCYSEMFLSLWMVEDDGSLDVSKRFAHVL